MATPISPCSNTTEAVHTAEEENAVEVVRSEAKIGENEDDENIVESDEGEGCATECEDLICAPCEDPDSIDADVDVEAEVQRAAVDPGQPTRGQREEHNLTHFPFRSWCRACVLGRAKDKPSRKIKAQFAESVLPRVRMDYCFLTEDVDKESGEHGETEVESARTTITVAVMQDSLTKSVWAYAVESKGSMEEWMVQQACEDLETIGLKNERIVLKSDQEPAMVDVLKEIQKKRECDFGSALDNSRVGDSDSNGTIESAIGSFEGVARTLRIALEEKIGAKVAASDPIVPWLIRHAGHIITRCWVRPNGKTAYQMIKGRRSNVHLKEFGEAVYFRIPETKNLPGKFEPRWEEGVYVGFNIRTGEELVSTDRRVFRVSIVRRRPVEERWSKELLDGIVGTPALPAAGVAGRRMPAYAKKFDGSTVRKPPEFVAQLEEEAPQTRTWAILKTDVTTHGPSPGCPGCRAIAKGASYKNPHTKECRLRFEAILSQSEEGRARMDRADERQAREILRHQGIDPHVGAPDDREGAGDDNDDASVAPPNPDDAPPDADEERPTRKSAASTEGDDAG